MNLSKVLKSLNDHKVQFVIIGATAAIAHGYERLTKDLDIFVKPTPENVQATLNALKSSGYDLQDTTTEEALNKKILFRQYILEVDLHPFVTGITFDQVWSHKVEYVLAGQKVNFASLDDLIIMKKAAGRPKDLEDLRNLEEIKRRIP